MLYIDLDELIKNRNKQGKKTNMLKLSKDTGISRNNLYNLKRGKAKGVEFPTLNSLMHYFNVPIDKILKYSKDDVYIDIYKHHQFFTQDEFNKIWDDKTKYCMKHHVYDKNKNENNNSKEDFTAYKTLVGINTMFPLMHDLYIQFTYKNKKHWYVLESCLKSEKNTINPKIIPNELSSLDFYTMSNFDYLTEDKWDKLKRGINTWQYVKDTFIQHMPYNQRLFILCRAVQYSNTISDMTYKKLNKNEKGHQSKELDDLFRPKHYPDRQQFILQLDNKGTTRQYRMTKNKILNYQQPSRTDFNNNFYNFIIRDHTKE